MNGTTLKALRLALGFSQQESANMIGQVQLRTWQYWEDADRAIPNDVIITMRELVQFKQVLIKNAISQIEKMIDVHGEPQSIHLTYYTNLDDWMTQDGATGIEWRPHCMAMGAIAEKYAFVSLIKFNPVEYRTWLGKRKDDSAMRAQWATLQ